MQSRILWTDNVEALEIAAKSQGIALHLRRPNLLVTADPPAVMAETMRAMPWLVGVPVLRAATVAPGVGVQYAIAPGREHGMWRGPPGLLSHANVMALRAVWTESPIAGAIQLGDRLAGRGAHVWEIGSGLAGAVACGAAKCEVALCRKGGGGAVVIAPGSPGDAAIIAAAAGVDLRVWVTGQPVGPVAGAW